MTTRSCSRCGIEFTPSGGADIKCHACRDTYEPTGQLAECIICGIEYRRVRGGGCCSSECSAEAKRERYRRKNRARRTKRKPGTYTLHGLAERDGRTCHICGGKVDMRLSGMHPKGATIDHLVPLSAGGLDEPTNVALAHRKCNVDRGVGGEVQLRLVG